MDKGAVRLSSTRPPPALARPGRPWLCSLAVAAGAVPFRADKIMASSGGSWRGPFERSPSRPDLNGVSHKSQSGRDPFRRSSCAMPGLSGVPDLERAGSECRHAANDLPVSSSVGKRQRERQKLERAQAKAERRAARQAGLPAGGDALGPADRSEPELIDELRALQRAFGEGEMSAEDFEEGRDRIQAQLQRLLS